MNPDEKQILASAARSPAAIGVLWAAILWPTAAWAQPITFTSRGGMNIAYCGIPGSGPLVQHNFSTPDPTDDVISVSDPGGVSWPSSAAVSQLDATPSLSGISIAGSGSARRGSPQGIGVNATADARDSWTFTLAAPVRFTFSVSISASSTEASVPVQGYTCGAVGPGQIIPDPGTPSDAFIGSFTVPGTTAKTASGTMQAGQYFISLVGRAEGNSFPYSGSFVCTLALSLAANAPVLTSIRVLSQGLELEWIDPTLRSYTVETSGSLANGTWTPVNGVAWPTQTNIVLVPLPAVSPAFFRVRAQ